MIRRITTTFLAGLVLAFGALSGASAASSAASDRQAKLQRALDRVAAAGGPGTIALVRDGGSTMRLTSGYGTLAAKTPIRSSDRFRVGSLTKTFVSTVVLQLADEGKLSLADSVERWLPGLVPNGRRISVRQLLNMRAGLYDYLNQDHTIERRMLAGDLTHRYAPRELVRIATRHKPNFAPGTSWSYCNTCYVLLGLIVEKASGRSIGAELSRRIFVPLRLRHTSFDTEPRIAGRHSHGYFPLNKRLLDVTVVSPSSAWAAGAMVSTVDDLDRFFSALNDGTLLPKPLLRAMTTPTSKSDGYGLGYARVETGPCGVLWWNGGNFAGFNASAYGVPGGKRQFVLFMNLDETGFTPKLQRALDRMLFTAMCGGRS